MQTTLIFFKKLNLNKLTLSLKWLIQLTCDNVFLICLQFAKMALVRIGEKLGEVFETDVFLFLFMFNTHQQLTAEVFLGS